MWNIISQPQLILQNKSFTEEIDVHIMESSYKVSVYGNKDPQELYMLSSEAPIEIGVSNFTGIQVVINDVPFKSGESMQMNIKSIKEGENIVVKVLDMKGNIKGITTFATMPTEFDRLQILNTKQTKHTYLFSFDKYVCKMDSNGDILYYRNAGVETGDFREHLIDGKKYYSYYVMMNTTEDEIARVVLDENYKTIDWIEFLTSSDQVWAATHLNKFVFEMLGEKHYILSGYVGKLVENLPTLIPHSEFGAHVGAAVIQEVKDGEVLFEWDSTQYPELYTMAYNNKTDFYNSSDFWVGYAQINGLLVDPRDKNLILSFPNLNTIIKIDKKTGQTIWVLGGNADQFNISDSQKFRNQLSLTLTEDDKFIIFEGNANENSDREQVGYAKILEIEINERDRTILEYKNYPIDYLHNMSEGVAHKIDNDRYIITFNDSKESIPIISQANLSTREIEFEVVSQYEIGKASHKGE